MKNSINVLITKKNLFGLLFLSFAISYSQVKDVDGNNYSMVLIGDLEVMAENLSVSHFRNGDIIQEAKTNEEWVQADKNEEPAWCYSNNNEEKGRLYNGHAVVDSRGLAPNGWHIPEMKEWKKLWEAAGGKKVAGEKMKNNTGWLENGNGNNESGFKGMPDGLRGYYGAFWSEGKTGAWWSSSKANAYTLSYFILYNHTSKIDRASSLFVQGRSVRCVKN